MPSAGMMEALAEGAARPFDLRPSSGRFLIVFFGFVNCPDICPTTLADVRHALARLPAGRERVELAFITVDLARDSLPVLAPYVVSFVANGHALRPESPRALAEAESAFGASSVVTRSPRGVLEVSHTGSCYLVNDHGDVVLEWEHGTTPDAMASDLMRMLGARSKASIGSGQGSIALPKRKSPEATSAWARSTAPNAAHGAVYLSLSSRLPDELLGVEVPKRVASRAEFHEATRDAEGRVGMRRRASIHLRAGDRVSFEPGGMHVMLLNLVRPLVAGDTFALTLRYRYGATQRVPVTVQDP
ncbi:MAG: copper chaperone PCu(A)C [Candidatus Eisenbacteria bacterium]|uniref:Copper chaperone PCu(A)C n=1 Tax=Eiseniibacteriota bacterium TaxID=2212470 RepID=A0A849SP21_UNCEI|nr:copper chaperone PCu(A)C [Candidatus Eisenbacteria bacterium]